MKITILFRIFLLSVLSSSMISVDAHGQQFEGKWRFTSIVEDKASIPNCRRFHVTTRKYFLTNRYDGRLEGTHIRELTPLWLGIASACPSGQDPGKAMLFFRSDSWYVVEKERNETQLNLHGEYNACVGGACDVKDLSVGQFHASILYENGFLIEESKERTIFVKEDIAGTAEREASKQALQLLKPLYEGDCNKFYEENFDPTTRANTPMSEFCHIARRMAELMPPILYDQPVTSLYFTNAKFRSLQTGAPLWFRGGDNVLLERAFVVEGGGGSVLVSTLLRRQTGGEWKVLSVAP